MDGTRAPALLPAALFALGIAIAYALPETPQVGAGAVLFALGAALGRRAGRLVAAAALGTIVGTLDAPRAPELRRDLVTEATGRVCGGAVERFGALAVPLCTTAVRQGREVRPSRLELSLLLPAGTPAPPPGARVRARGPLTRSAGFANESVVAPGPWRLRVKAARFLVIVAPPSPPARAVAALRRALRSAYERPEWRERPGVAVARALALGEAAALPDAWRRALRRTGLAHLVAVSGFNVSLVAGLAAAAGSGLSRRARLLLAAATVIAFVAAVGSTASVLRASGMALLALVGLGLSRAPQARQGLGLALIALLALEPALVGDPGFQLSFAATAGLLLLAPRWADRLALRLPPFAASALAASLAAQAASLPWSVAAFGEVAPLAALFNLAAVGWAACALVVGGIWTFLALLAPALAGALLPLLDALALPLELLARLPASAWLSLPWPGGWISALPATAVLAAIAEGGRVGRAAAMAGLLLLQVGHGAAPPAAHEAVFVDVGQGDATLLVSGEGALLVDGGGAPGFDLGGRVLRPLLARRGVWRLRAAVVTHTDGDHCLGLRDLAAYVPIDEVWAPRGSERDPCVAALARVARRGASFLVAGDRRRTAGFDLLVLHPAAESRGSDNERSLVLRANAAGRRLLLAADVSAHEEEELLRWATAELAADLLKVPHHGSAGSSSERFLAAVRARLAVVSAGVGNPYGHPSPAALSRLAQARAIVLRTERDGEVSVAWRAGQPLRIALPGSPRRVGPGT